MEPIGSGEYESLAQLRYEIRRFVAFSEDAARSAGIEPRQHQLLLLLKGLPREERPTIGTIAQRLFVRHHTAAELVGRSERDALVTRSRGPEDRREVQVAVTPRGEEVLERLTRVHREELRTVGPRMVRALSAIVPSETMERP